MENAEKFSAVSEAAEEHRNIYRDDYADLTRSGIPPRSELSKLYMKAVYEENEAAYQELIENEEFKAVMARRQAANDKLESNVMAAAEFAQHNLSDLFQIAMVEMDNELIGRENAQHASRAELTDPDDDASVEQALMIARLLRRNYTLAGLGILTRFSLLPNDRIMTIQPPLSGFKDFSGRNYEFSVKIEPATKYLGELDRPKEIGTIYYVSDRGIEKDPAITPYELADYSRGLMAGWEEANAKVEESIDEWGIERELGLHRVTTSEAEDLAEILRVKWEPLSLSQILGEEPLPNYN